MKKDRKLYVEFLRIIACYFVIFNHTFGYHYYLTEAYGPKLWIHMFASMFTRFNVPIFFMISGLLLLGKPESMADIFKKRVMKMVVVLTAASLVLYCWYVVRAGNGSFGNFIKVLLADNVSGAGAYWYFYSYLSFLLLLPFLRPIVQKIGDREYGYLLILHVILCTVIPLIGYFHNGFAVALNIPLSIDNFLFYPLMGYWLGSMDIKRFRVKTCVGLIIASIFSVGLESWLTVHFGSSGAYSQNYVILLDYVIAITVFYVVRYCFHRLRVNEKVANVIIFWGGLTFGIYLLDPIIGTVIKKAHIWSAIGGFKGAFVYCLVSMLMCGVITALLKKLPIVRKYL